MSILQSMLPAGTWKGMEEVGLDKNKFLKFIKYLLNSKLDQFLKYLCSYCTHDFDNINGKRASSTSQR